MSKFAGELKRWRVLRRFSQLGLATEAGISSRHLSFLETGRARPSRSMVLRLSRTLQVPLDARNQMLAHAGFAAAYGKRDWSDEEMAPLQQAVDRLLDNHSPYPGLALDRRWHILQTNRAASALFKQFGVGVGDSLVDLMTSQLLPDMVENWPDVARNISERLRTESIAQGGVASFNKAVAYLAEFASGSEGAKTPVVPVILRQGNSRLSMFATITQLGTPEDVVLDDLKVELYYPMDDETKQTFEALDSAG